MAQPLVVRPDKSEDSLLATLKALELHKTVSSEPILTALRHYPAQPAQYVGFPEGLHPKLAEVLRKRGYPGLYTHQRQAYDAVQAGKSTVVVTPTASGKTLCYNLPVLDRILKDPDARALYLFPTKALAQDQLAELYSTVEALGADIGTFTYDGDTPQDARKAIRARAHVVVTNPDMLHKGILPHHTKWVKLFENLRYVVVDELHSYRGVYGSHVANVFRRLQRLCRFYGSDPQFLCCSATIGNPKELAEAVTGREMTLVDNNGAPRGEKYFAIYNPPVVNRQLGIRKSALGSARDVALSFLAKGLQTIVFAPSRLATEVLVTYLKEALETRPGSEGVIRGYRGGYLPLKRREIERGLREGSVLGVVSTNALELGIDIGSLDAAVLLGYPGSVASAWQQAGRAGRRSGTSVAVLVANSTPLNQFIAKHPDYFFGAPAEQGRINPDNLQILLNHVKCAAFELPFSDDERLRQGGAGRDPALPGGREAAAPVGGALALDERKLPRRRGQPAQRLLGQLRGAGRHARAAHHRRGGLRLAPPPWSTRRPSTSSRASTYFVEKYDHQERRVHVREAEVDYYTDAITYTKVRILDRLRGGGPGPGASQPRRGARDLAGGGLQEDQVLDQRKRGRGRSGDARERDAHHVLLAHHPARSDAHAALRPRGAARRGGGPGLHPGPARGPLPDVRPPRPGGRARGQRPGRGAARARAHAPGSGPEGTRRARYPAKTTSPRSSSTTPTRAASASRSRCIACTTGWCASRAR